MIRNNKWTRTAQSTFHGVFFTSSIDSWNLGDGVKYLVTWKVAGFKTVVENICRFCMWYFIAHMNNVMEITKFYEGCTDQCSSQFLCRERSRRTFKASCFLYSINFKFPLQPHQEYHTTQYTNNLASHSLLIWKMIITANSHYLTYKYIYFNGWWENVLFELWSGHWCLYVGPALPRTF